MAAQVASARSSQQLLSIGQVLAKLTPEFPDLTQSKLRFLEAERLVFPARTEAGYRKFSHADIEQLRWVLTMQLKPYFWPLKAIREQLEEYRSGRIEQLAAPVRPSATLGAAATRRFTRADLLRESGATAQLLADAVAYSLLPAVESYGEDAVVLLRSLVELGQVGIEPRHLRGFRAAAEREVSLVDQAVDPIRRQKAVGAAARAAEAAKEVAAHLEQIRSTIIRTALERRTN